MLVRIPELTPDQMLRLLRHEACVRIYDVPFALAGVRADGLLTVEPWESTAD